MNTNIIPLNFQGLLLFDIDGVIRDVSGSYRLAIQETVEHFSGWRPPTESIDALKAEGCWNNDWDTSIELINRNKTEKNSNTPLPNREQLIEVFSNFYFGGDPAGDRTKWKGFIRNEPLLVEHNFFEQLTQQKIAWGFVSGAEPASASFVLEDRLGLENPPIIAMGDAPSKPDPTGLLRLSKELLGKDLGEGRPPIAYLGDTVADILTIKRARKECPKQNFMSLAVAPPHLHQKSQEMNRQVYESCLKKAGAEEILTCTTDAMKILS